VYSIIKVVSEILYQYKINSTVSSYEDLTAKCVVVFGCLANLSIQEMLLSGIHATLLLAFNNATEYIAIRTVDFT